jgi:hypothetical protein
VAEPALLTIPGDPDRENEDAVLAGPDRAVVVDGAGIPPEWRAGCHHSVAWYSHSLATDPVAAEQAIYGELPLDQVYGIIAASDGATRGYQLLDLHSLTEVADQILTSPTDLSSIGQAIRTSETRQAAALQARANKVHDDLTIAAAHIFER